ncbi:MAG: nicotinate-nucleotide adenylyltransferase [Chloroflexi bacterium]|nr:nicotinate-nucleotide adenylyltransferase [Chloroflexota bacterium]
MRRLGLLGGTFDPPHYGHLVAAQEVAWRLELDRVLFLPARQNPLKRDEPSSSAEDRCAMVTLAIVGNPIFEVSRLDLDRPPPSYTADLLKVLASAESDLYFVIGADILPELPRWRDPDEILRLARLAVVNRPGAPPPNLRGLDELSPGASSRATLVEIPGLAIASRELRLRAREGQPIRYLTPPAVERYIVERGLYRARSGTP